MKRILTALALIIILLSLYACGGGGGGGGSNAGDKAVVRIVNATGNVAALNAFVDGINLFSLITNGQASDYEPVQEGDRLVELIESAAPNRKIEFQNQFKVGVPYTIVASGTGSNLSPIVAVNDRSDTPTGQFRIRAINSTSSASSLTLRLVPGVVGRDGGSSVLRAEGVSAATPVAVSSGTPATLTPTVVPTVSTTSAQPTISATPSAAVTPSSSPTVATTVSATATVVAPTATPVVSVGPVNTEVIASNLRSGSVSDYSNVVRSDYRIEVLQDGNRVYSSGVISFGLGQVETVVIKGNPNRPDILRLNDRP